MKYEEEERRSTAIERSHAARSQAKIEEKGIESLKYQRYTPSG